MALGRSGTRTTPRPTWVVSKDGCTARGCDGGFGATFAWRREAPIPGEVSSFIGIEGARGAGGILGIEAALGVDGGGEGRVPGARGGAEEARRGSGGGIERDDGGTEGNEVEGGLTDGDAARADAGGGVSARGGGSEPRLGGADGGGGRTARTEGGGGAICSALVGRDGGGILGGGVRSASRDDGGISSGVDVVEPELIWAALMAPGDCKRRTAS